MTEVLFLHEAKEQLDKTTTADDAEIMDFIEATTFLVEGFIGPIRPTAFVEKHPSGGDYLLLFRMPVLSVTSVEPWFDSGTSYAPGDLVVDTETGRVYRKNGLCFTGGPFKVTYSAGRTAVPANVRLAARMIIGHLWETQRGRLIRIPAPGGGETQARVPPGYAAPKHAQELLGSRGPVVA